MGQPPRLIINADDFGWAESINRAVDDGHRAGVITSATLLVTGPALESAVQVAHHAPRLGVGLHFNLTEGRPVSEPGQIPSLVDNQGRFLSRGGLIKAGLTGRLNPDQVALELAAQWRLFMETGLSASHLDGHQHVHFLPRVIEVVLEFCGREKLPLRWPDEQVLPSGEPGGKSSPAQLLRKALFRFWIKSQRGKVTVRGLATNDHLRSPFGFRPLVRPLTIDHYKLLTRNLDQGVTELMVHPAYDRDAAELWPSDPALIEDRMTEAAVLTDPDLAAFLKEQPLTLINYRELSA